MGPTKDPRAAGNGPVADPPSGQDIEAYAAGELEGASAARIEESLARCSATRAQAESWAVLHETLGRLSRLEPRPDLADRILAEPPRRRLFGATSLVESCSRLLRRRRRGEHLEPRLVDDLAEGVLRPSLAVHAESHTLGCASCAEALGRTRATFHALAGLGHFRTSPGFVDRVMATVAAEATSRESVGPYHPFATLLSWAKTSSGWLAPRTAEGWARLGGIAVTPAACIALVVHSLASHPTLSVGELLAYVWWEAGQRLDGLEAALATGAHALGETGFYGVVASSAAWLALGMCLYGVACLFSARTIYRWAHSSFARLPRVRG